MLTIYIPGDVDPYDSYGLIACNLLEETDALGVDCQVSALADEHCPTQNANVARLMAREKRPSSGGVFCGFPTSYHRHDGFYNSGPRFALTMHESTKIPGEWPSILNDMDGVIVPSQSSREIFQSNGVTVPVHVIPLGISQVYQRRKRESGRPYTFLAIGDRGGRKNSLSALSAFVEAFGDDANYQLIIKCRENVKQRLECLNPNITYLYQDMTEQQLYNLYCDCDCMVFPSRGEGFGLPPREFAATGGTVIATNWSGLIDDIDIWGIPLPYSPVKANWRGVRPFQGRDLGQWAEPDTDALIVIMREVAKHREHYARRAWQQAPLLHHLYSWRDCARRLLTIWQGVIQHGYQRTAESVLV